MKRITNRKVTVTLTEDQFYHVIRGLECTVEDYMEDYDGADKIAVRNNKQAQKYNAFVQRLINNLVEQASK